MEVTFSMPRKGRAAPATVKLTETLTGPWEGEGTAAAAREITPEYTPGCAPKGTSTPTHREPVPPASREKPMLKDCPAMSRPCRLRKVMPLEGMLLPVETLVSPLAQVAVMLVAELE